MIVVDDAVGRVRCAGVGCCCWCCCWVIDERRLVSIWVLASGCWVAVAMVTGCGATGATGAGWATDCSSDKI